MSFAQATARHERPYHPVIHWILHLGVAGVFGVALLDASPLPLPMPGSTDVLILVLAVHGEPAWLLALAGVTGSMIGAYLTWSAGKKGGAAMLDRYVNQRIRSHVTRRIRSHGTVTVCIAALLPPPLPLMPFLLAAGALGVTRRQLLVALGVARSIRYGTEAALAILFGRRILRFWRHSLAGASAPILYSFLGLLAAAIAFGIWKYWHDRRQSARSDQKAGAHAAS